MNPKMTKHLKDLRKEIKNFYLKEEIMCKQRSRVNWIKVGDCNMAYFHKVGNFRTRHNTIYSVKVDGS